MAGFVAATALLVLPPVAGRAVAAAAAAVSAAHQVVAATGGVVVFAGYGTLIQVGTATTSTLIVTLSVYGTLRLGGLTAYLAATRTELPDAAVAAERLRVARDLHDPLGYSLSAVVLKGELALRLLERDHGRAATELARMEQMAREAAVSTQAVARGAPELAFESELASAAEVLSAGSVRAVPVVDPDAVRALSPTDGTVLATVLRDAVTNALRHGAPSTCEIRLTRDGDAVRLAVTNEGAPEPPERGGSGLTGLTDRVGLLGGTLTAGRDGTGGFRVVVDLPLR